MNKSVQLVEGASGAFHFEDLYPPIDGSRFRIKRIVGEHVEVWADLYRDGHDVTAASLVWRHKGEHEWHRAPMTHHSNDRWFGALIPEQAGRYCYTIEIWAEGAAPSRRRGRRAPMSPLTQSRARAC